MFSIFTADLPRCIEIYKDDTQLYYSFNDKDGEEAIKKINHDFQKVYSWSKKNYLVLNPVKSQRLVLGTKLQVKTVLDCDEKIKVNNVEVELITSARNLGLVWGREKRYVEHINIKIKNGFFKSKTLYKIRPLLLADLLVLAPFNYCASVSSTANTE